jgi:hypothetical protein
VVKLKENTMAMPPSPKKSFKFVDVSPPEADDQLLVPKKKNIIKPKPRPEKRPRAMDRSRQFDMNRSKKKPKPVPDIQLPQVPPRGLVDPESVVPAKFSEGGRLGDVRDNPNRGKTY